MKKIKSLLMIVVIFLSIFLIYSLNATKKYKYIALGDSLAIGQNPYKEIGYGYSDFVSNYLEKNNRLTLYTKDYAQAGYKISDLKKSILNNKKISVNNNMIGLKETLRESNLVTISIGGNDLLEKLNISSLDLTEAKDKTINEINKVFLNLDELLKEIKKYAKGEIIVIGYYNPIPRITLIKEKVDELIKYSDQQFEVICNKYKIKFIPISSEIDKNIDVLPNPLDIHLSLKGYEIIANKIIDHLESK